MHSLKKIYVFIFATLLVSAVGCSQSVNCRPVQPQLSWRSNSFTSNSTAVKLLPNGICVVKKPTCSPCERAVSQPCQPATGSCQPVACAPAPIDCASIPGAGACQTFSEFELNHSNLEIIVPKYEESASVTETSPADEKIIEDLRAPSLENKQEDNEKNISASQPEVDKSTEKTVVAVMVETTKPETQSVGNEGKNTAITEKALESAAIVQENPGKTKINQEINQQTAKSENIISKEAGTSELSEKPIESVTISSLSEKKPEISVNAEMPPVFRDGADEKASLEVVNNPSAPEVVSAEVQKVDLPPELR